MIFHYVDKVTYHSLTLLRVDDSKCSTLYLLFIGDDRSGHWDVLQLIDGNEKNENNKEQIKKRKKIGIS